MILKILANISIFTVLLSGCKPMNQMSETKAIVDSNAKNGQYRSFTLTAVMHTSESINASTRDAQLRSNASESFSIIECSTNSLESSISKIDGIDTYSLISSIFVTNNRMVWAPNSKGKMSKVNDCELVVNSPRWSFNDIIGRLGNVGSDKQIDIKTQTIYLALRGLYSSKHPNNISPKITRLAELAKRENIDINSDKFFETFLTFDKKFNPCLQPTKSAGGYNCMAVDTYKSHFSPGNSQITYDSVLKSLTASNGLQLAEIPYSVTTAFGPGGTFNFLKNGNFKGNSSQSMSNNFVSSMVNNDPSLFSSRFPVAGLAHRGNSNGPAQMGIYIPQTDTANARMYNLPGTISNGVFNPSEGSIPNVVKRIQRAYPGGEADRFIQDLEEIQEFGAASN